MLKILRSNVKALSWTLWLVIIAFIGFIFVQWGAGGELGGKGKGNTLIWIGKKTVTKTQFSETLLRSLSGYQEQMKGNFNKSFITQLGIPEQVMQSMVYVSLVQQEAKKLGLRVTDQEISDAITSNPVFQRAGKFIGAEEYQRFLIYQRIKVSDYEASVGDEIAATKLKDLLSAQMILTPKELREAYRKENDQAELEYIVYNPTDDTKIESAIDEAKIAAYHEKHKTDYQTQEKRSGNIVLFKFDEYKKEVTITPQEKTDYWTENRINFKIPGKTKVSRILLKYAAEQRINVLAEADRLKESLNQENFSDQARTISQDDKAKDGGDWGYWEWQRLSQPEKDIIERLDQAEISNPVDTGDGFALFLITEKVAEIQQEKAAVLPQIEATLEREKLREIVIKKANKLYSKIKDVKDLGEAVKKNGYAYVRSTLLNRGEPIKDVDPAGYVSQQLFGMKKSEISMPIEIPNGMVLVQLLEIERPRPQTLEEAREQVKIALLAEEKLDRLEVEARRLLDEIRAITDAKKVEEKLQPKKLKLETATLNHGGQIGSLSTKKGLSDFVFSSPEGWMTEPLRLPKEVVLVKVKSKKISSSEEFEKNYLEFYKKQFENRKNDVFTSYMMNKRKEYEVRINPELYDETIKETLARFR